MFSRIGDGPSSVSAPGNHAPDNGTRQLRLSHRRARPIGFGTSTLPGIRGHSPSHWHGRPWPLPVPPPPVIVTMGLYGVSQARIRDRDVGNLIGKAQLAVAVAVVVTRQAHPPVRTTRRGTVYPVPGVFKWIPLTVPPRTDAPIVAVARQQQPPCRYPRRRRPSACRVSCASRNQCQGRQTVSRNGRESRLPHPVRSVTRRRIGRVTISRILYRY